MMERNVLMHGSEAMIFRNREIFTVRALQMGNLRSLLGIRRIDRIPKALDAESCEVKKRMDEIINKIVFHWFGHIEKNGRSRSPKRINEGKCTGISPVGRPKKKFI